MDQLVMDFKFQMKVQWCLKKISAEQYTVGEKANLVTQS